MFIDNIIWHFFYNSDSSSSSSDNDEVHETSTVPVISNVPLTISRTTKVKKPASKIPKPILHVKNIGGKKSQGHRQARRHENSLSIYYSILLS